MRIDCGICGAKDKVWASKGMHTLLSPTLEVGTNAVSCRACNQEGFADLNAPFCRNKACGSKDLWRWPNRSMDTNCRRWMCRACGEVSAFYETVEMYMGAPHGVIMASRSQFIPQLCGQCGAEVTFPSRSYMKKGYCKGPTRHVIDFVLHEPGVMSKIIQSDYIVFIPELRDDDEILNY